jgi:hypothetical protein
MKRLLLSLGAATLAGCSVSPAPLLTIPQGHPGSAESAEAPYAPPADPFKQDVPDATPPGPKEGHDHGKAEAPKKPYPLDTCPVSGEKLGTMGKPVVLQHEGREVRLCCPGCLDKFKKDPAPYMKKLDEAEKAKKPEHGDHK